MKLLRKLAVNKEHYKQIKNSYKDLTVVDKKNLLIKKSQ